MKIRIATRGSKLALWQTEHVIAMVSAAMPDVVFEKVIVKTLGDKVQDQPLFKVGGQGLFIKEIEETLLSEKADIAIHSLKDMPHQLREGLILCAVSAREDPRDAFLSSKRVSFSALPEGAVIGTSSLRRRAQLSVLRKDLTFVDLRGNLETRLRKLQSENLDGIVLAAAGLKRLKLGAHVQEFFELNDVIPAAGQGLLGIECRASDLERLKPVLSVVEDSRGRTVATAERAFLKELQGGCQVPMAVHATLDGEEILVRGFIGDPNGKNCLFSSVTGPANEADRLGTHAAKDLVSRGGRTLLEEVRKSLN